VIAKLGAIQSGQALVVVVIAPDGTVSAQGPFYSADKASEHADTWITDGGVHAAVTYLEVPQTPAEGKGP
jgi:hypothetical protein